MIPISKVELGPEEEAQVLEVLRSGHLAQGPKVAEFESRCAQLAGTQQAVAVNNGTTALVLAIEGLGLGPDDEVITSPFTFSATINAILESGATVRFGDIGDDYNLDPTTTLSLIGGATRAIMPVHLYGQTADMETFRKLAAEHGLPLIEDAAQAHGATTSSGARAGSFGLGCFSFYATKNVMCGEGGVITLDDHDLADRLRILRNQGMRSRYDYVVPGHNYRMTDLVAAIALPQFDQLEARVERRRHNAARLNAGLDGISGVVLPRTAPGRGHVWHQYTIRLSSAARLNREELAAVLSEADIGHGFYYPRAVYDYECYRSHPRVVIDGSPRAEEAAASVISLPVHPLLTDQDLDLIVETVDRALR
ncbi:MAG: DegT/DnrJ/EryC1/StrS family aminotransferase [Actinomycetia bacterium]|nr:DegT/DnrJ/EryC1/StrS family aminotransferase [Actinomycetes bacterium]